MFTNSSLRKTLFIVIYLLSFSLAGQYSWATPAENASAKALKQINQLPTTPDQYIEWLSKLDNKSYANEFKKINGFEEKHKYWDSIQVLEKLAAEFPEAPYLMWRLARTYWVYAENLDINDKQSRLKYFQAGLDWANKGIQTDPNCAECYLFKFGNLGRISTTKGLMNSISAAKELSETIAKAIELEPKHSDTYYNKELGNAYYASGVFYRIIPDWLIIRWIAGVRGDKLKSLEHIKKATEISPARIDYMVELGAIYLCLANDKKMEEMRAPGIKALEKAITMEQVMPTDTLDKEYAAGFLKDSKGACGFSRDGIVDLDKKKFEDNQ